MCGTVTRPSADCESSILREGILRGKRGDYERHAWQPATSLAARLEQSRKMLFYLYYMGSIPAAVFWAGGTLLFFIFCFLDKI
jgi:hypothetical protein